MTDYGLPAAVGERAPLLIRRRLAYVAACLNGAQDHVGDTTADIRSTPSRSCPIRAQPNGQQR